MAPFVTQSYLLGAVWGVMWPDILAWKIFRTHLHHKCILFDSSSKSLQMFMDDL